MEPGTDEEDINFLTDVAMGLFLLFTVIVIGTLMISNLFIRALINKLQKGKINEMVFCAIASCAICVWIFYTCIKQIIDIAVEFVQPAKNS